MHVLYRNSLQGTPDRPSAHKMALTDDNVMEDNVTDDNVTDDDTRFLTHRSIAHKFLPFNIKMT